VNDTAGKRIAAEGEFIAAPGVTLQGEAELKEVAGGVRIEVDVKDAPAGPKGIHIHQKGDCSDIPGKSMGEHLTMTEDEQHGLPGAPHHHAGDMGNIQISDDGKGKLTFVVPAVHLEGDDALSLAHRAIVIHEQQDVGTGPSGESGKPIACAVILPSA
jgi:Cu-Zn family superoxide dismutase